MVLSYLEQGYLSRPVGGTAAFRDALEQSYRAHGGEVVLHATVDEVLVRDDCVSGVRLADGTQLAADIVISTASAPETVLRLLGGRYDADATRQRLEQ
jgi:phytoene dehydrogenase-like protein